MPRAARLAIFCCLLTPSAYMAWSFRDIPDLGSTGDDQIYLASAKSLASGEGYRIPNLPGDVYQTRFPLLYPLLLSMVWILRPEFPGNLPAFMLCSWLAMPVFLLLARRMFHSLGHEEAESWLMCALLACNPGVIASCITPGPDLIFSALLLLLFLFLPRAAQQAPPYAGLAGLLAGLLYLLRSAAAPLLVSVPLLLLWRRKVARAILFFVGMVPFGVAWSLWSRSHITQSNDPTIVFYTDYFRDYLLNFSWQTAPVLAAKNLAWFVEYSGLLVAFVPVSPWPWLCGAIALAGAIGLIRRTGLTQYHLFAAAYCALLVLWTGKPLLRYILPVTPLLLAGFVYGITTAVGLVSHGVNRAASAAALWLLICLTVLIGLPPQFASLSRQRRQKVPEREAYAWIRRTLPPTASFLANKEGVLFLETGRRAMTYQALKRDVYTGNSEALQQWVEAMPRFAREHGVEYVFCDSSTCPGALTEDGVPRARTVLSKSGREVFRAGAVTVYRLAE